jgi:hypothetical protein
MDTDKDVGIRSIPTLSIRDQKPTIDEEAKWAHTGYVCCGLSWPIGFFESVGAGQASRFRHSPASLQARMVYENTMRDLSKLVAVWATQTPIPFEGLSLEPRLSWKDTGV